MRTTAGGVVLVLVGVVALIAGINGTYGRVWTALMGIETIGTTVEIPTKPKPGGVNDIPAARVPVYLDDYRLRPGAPGSGVQIS